VFIFKGYLWVEEVATNSKFIDKIKHDARTYNGVAMNKPGYELLCLIDDARAAVKNINVPFIAFHGQNDIVTFPSGSNYLMKYSSTPNHLKSFKLVPNCKHHTFHEVDSISIPAIEKYVTYIAGFLKPQEESGIRVASAT
jgi:alpha-beta hydrolase superfamily lysophospholipase